MTAFVVALLGYVAVMVTLVWLYLRSETRWFD